MPIYLTANISISSKTAIREGRPFSSIALVTGPSSISQLMENKANDTRSKDVIFFIFLVISFAKVQFSPASALTYIPVSFINISCLGAWTEKRAKATVKSITAGCGKPCTFATEIKTETKWKDLSLTPENHARRSSRKECGT